jgi:holo-[acyl-carrier protein] synthase
MAHIGIGTDIVELERVEHIGELRRFAEYFLTPAELAAFAANSDPIRFVASRFAAKEAVIKACPDKLKPHDFEILKKGVKPMVRFVAADLAARYEAVVSLSHSTRYAAGYAVVTRRGE